MGLYLCNGQLSKVVGNVSNALAPVYGQLLDTLPQQKRLGVDETGHEDSGQRMWTWCFRADEFAVYRIMASRGSEVLRETLGEAFAGGVTASHRRSPDKCPARAETLKYRQNVSFGLDSRPTSRRC